MDDLHFLHSMFDSDNILSDFSLETLEPQDILHPSMVGRSTAMKEVFEKIKQISSNGSHVLIGAQAGTGKKLAAQVICDLSDRNGCVFSISCAAISKELLERQLFSAESKLRLADRGALVLDGVEYVPPDIWEKLSDFLQKSDIRMIALAQTNFEYLASTWRRCLDIEWLPLPTLKERGDDIILLACCFFNKFSKANGSAIPKVDEEVFKLLSAWHWPGNVAELEGLIERLVILKSGQKITIEDLPNKFLANRSDKLVEIPPEGIDLRKFLSDLENSLISQALEVTNGNKNQASKLLRMNRTTLIEKMKKKGLLRQNRQTATS